MLALPSKAPMSTRLPSDTDREATGEAAETPLSPAITLDCSKGPKGSRSTRTSVPTCAAAWSVCESDQVAWNDWAKAPMAMANVRTSTAPVALRGRRPTSQAASGAASERLRPARRSATAATRGSSRSAMAAPASRNSAGPTTSTGSTPPERSTGERYWRSCR